MERLRDRAGIPAKLTFAPRIQAMATALVEAFSETQFEVWDYPGLRADLRSLRVVERSSAIDSMRPGTKPATPIARSRYAWHSSKRGK